MKSIKVKDVISQAKYWAKESQCENYSENLRKHFHERACTIVTILTNIELDRMKINIDNIDRFNKMFDEIYGKYYKEIFG